MTTYETYALYDAMRTVLGAAGAPARGLAPGDLKAVKKLGMRVHGRAGQPCPVCGDTVREVSFADSSLDYCATCQTGGKPLADRRLSRLLK
jgi:formamidopyrimidine-DNA glycosylase